MSRNNKQLGKFLGSEVKDILLKEIESLANEKLRRKDRIISGSILVVSLFVSYLLRDYCATKS